MRFFLPLLLVALSGCASVAAPGPTPLPTHVAVAHVTPTPLPRPAAASLDPRYRRFVHNVCSALAARNAAAIASVLMNYQYNTGLRWGMMGDGEGQSAPPGLLSTWLARARVRCAALTSDAAGHGAVLTSGWLRPAGWAVIEFDTVNGVWKVNDFTFGSQSILEQAIHVNAATVVPYRA